MPARNRAIAFSIRRARVSAATAPARAIDVLAEAFATFAGRGLLQLEDSRLAAAHYAYLVLAIPQDRAQFEPSLRPSPAERERLATEAVRVFLAAYGV